ncbi:hypothetical protein J2809_000110 [Arthrobacter pascens]|uniref:hypothetical protein n=1 Tax=Arthrobacter pascens TaxID=1677 RepID=UPI002863261D|nr:hypothetical protein [Arthrobacter pascens]MDR6555779.1 hypothetical protein [Arthrobacter pascens]
MTSVSKWVAAGSSAAVFAGGLLIAAPMATAAPGDAACLEASVQFEAALGAAGITETSVADIEAASEAAAAAEATYVALVSAAGAGPRAALDDAMADLETARAAAVAAEAAEDQAEASGNAAAIEAAKDAHDAAEAAEEAAEVAVRDLEEAYTAAISTPDILEAQGALDLAVEAVEDALAAVSLDEASAENLLGLFQAFLAACNPDAIGVDPVGTPVVTPPVAAPVNASESTTPAVANPVGAPPAGAGTAKTAAVATNRGLNIQTAAAAEPGVHPGLALLAGLLAAGIAVPAAVALRMRRLERSRN